MDHLHNRGVQVCADEAESRNSHGGQEMELAASYIDEIYRDKKLPKRKSKAVREFLGGDTIDDVDEMIRRYREAERE